MFPRIWVPTLSNRKKSISITNGLQGKDQFKEQLIAQLKKADAKKTACIQTVNHPRTFPKVAR